MVTPASLRIILRHSVPESILGACCSLLRNKVKTSLVSNVVLLAQPPDDVSNGEESGPHTLDRSARAREWHSGLLQLQWLKTVRTSTHT
jgi:hypothetical protein